MVARCVVSSLVAMAALAAAACTPPVNPAGDPLRPPGTREAFEGVSCSAVRPQTEPDLMAWDPGSRANLSRLRRRGVVAVRYQAKGCNVELELLSNCIGTRSKYEFAPYSANERKVAHNASELFAELPIGAARLSGKVKGSRALRTDYMLAGQYALPPEATFSRADLQGVDCPRATHVVSAVYVGAFAMAAGEQRAIEGKASVFGLGASGASQADVEVVGDEGDADACKTSQKEHKESDGCGVPLRVGLVPLEAPAAPGCPDGSELQGDKCVRKNVVTQVDCPAGTKWNGSKCAPAQAAPSVPAQAAPSVPAQAAPSAPPSPSALVVCGRFQVLDAGDAAQPGSGLVRDTKTGLTWTRHSAKLMKQAEAGAYCAGRAMRLPSKEEATSILSVSCGEAWPKGKEERFHAWRVWTSEVAKGYLSGPERGISMWSVDYDGRAWAGDPNFAAGEGALCVR